jgi:hypothetical protein
MATAPPAAPPPPADVAAEPAPLPVNHVDVDVVDAPRRATPAKPMPPSELSKLESSLSIALVAASDSPYGILGT